jgi:hypothetical protein
VRELDEAGLGLVELNLNRPTLDDVFLQATGARLQGVDEKTEGLVGGQAV